VIQFSQLTGFYSADTLLCVTWILQALNTSFD